MQASPNNSWKSLGSHPILLPLLLLFLSTACNHRQAHGSERLMLPQTWTDQFWVFDQIMEPAAGPHIHTMLLLTRSTMDHGKATAFYCGQWNAADNSYRFGANIGPDGNWSKPETWPMVATLPSDTAHKAWRLYLHRNAFSIEGSFQYPEPQDFKLTGAWGKTDTTKVFVFAMLENFRLLEPRTGPMRMSGHAQGNGLFQGGLFADANELLQDPQTKAVYYFHLTDLALNASSYHVFTLDSNNEIQVKAKYEFHEGSWYVSSADYFSGKLTAIHPWESPHSHKQYKLGIEYRAASKLWELKPLKQDQEIQAGKRSFWMGAVTQTSSPAAGAQRIIGNMFIFQR